MTRAQDALWSIILCEAGVAIEMRAPCDRA
jgi:hypothetical protein